MVALGAGVVGAEEEVVDAFAALDAFALGAADVVAASVPVAAAAAAADVEVVVVVVPRRDGAELDGSVVGDVEVAAEPEVGGAALVVPPAVVEVVVGAGGGAWVGSVAGMGRQRSPPSRTSSRYGGAVPSSTLAAGPAKRSRTGVPVGSGRQPTSVAS
jgi:hypothetical protein